MGLEKGSEEWVFSQDLLEMLIERKHDYYSSIKRMIIDFKIEPKKRSLFKCCICTRSLKIYYIPNVS